MPKKKPSKLGPYIIMDYIEGAELWTLLQQPKATHHEESERNVVYEQMADYMLQPS
jgi:aminoglycoside phosphotransferase (APT) family kinase protein